MGIGGSAAAATLSTCTQSYAAWTQVRDSALVRLEPTPTLLGLDNTWCARSPAQIADLRARLAAVKTVCASVEQKDQARVSGLIARTERLLSQTRACAPPATVTERDDWSTSVRPVSPSAGKEPARKKVAAPATPGATSEPGKSKAAVVTALAKPSAVKPAAPEAKAAQGKPGTKAKPADRGTFVSPPSPLVPAVVEPRLSQGGAVLQPISVAASPQDKTPVAAGSAPPAGDPASASPASASAAPPSHAASDPECLSVTTSSTTTFVVENTHCPSQIVLTAIELGGEDQSSRCFTKKIRSQISLASAASTPHINYQCIEGSPGCSVEVLRGMFPECYAG